MGRGSLRSMSRLRRTSRLGRAAFVMSAGFVASCGGGSSNGVTSPVGSTPVLTVVRVSLSSDTIPVGQSAAASAAGLDQNSVVIGIGAPLWTTASPSVATVSASGVVSAVAPGQTMVIASVNGKQGQLSLTVVQVPIARVSITPGAARVARGATLQLTATPLDFSGRVLRNRTVGWTTSDAAQATVTSAGVVTAVAPGVVTVNASSEGISASAIVTVTSSVDSVATVTMSPPVGTLTVGGSMQLAATLKDIAGNTLTGGRTVTWSASGVAGANVATVSDAGLVTAVSPGTVIVQAFSEGQHGAATITVKDNVDTNIVVTFASPEENEVVGDTLRVVVGVKAVSPLASVVAAVGSKRTTLVLTPVGARGTGVAWVGLIDITDLPTGPYQVVVTATDMRSARGVGSRPFQRDTRKGKGGTGDQPKMK